MRFLLLLAGCAIILSGCDDQRIFEKNVDLEDRYWLIDNQLLFEFEITDTAQQYNLYCNLRNSSSYPWSRIFIGNTLTDSTGRELRKELLTEDLFNRKTGEPLGSSALGDIFDHRITILENYSFQSPGKYKVQFEQFMRQDTLRGVLSVGLRVEKAPKK